jgi:hypothetical protein
MSLIAKSVDFRWDLPFAGAIFEVLDWSLLRGGGDEMFFQTIWENSELCERIRADESRLPHPTRHTNCVFSIKINTKDES